MVSLLTDFHALSLPHFPLLHFPSLLFAPAFSTSAFSTTAFSAPPSIQLSKTKHFAYRTQQRTLVLSVPYVRIRVYCGYTLLYKFTNYLLTWTRGVFLFPRALFSHSFIHRWGVFTSLHIITCLLLIRWRILAGSRTVWRRFCFCVWHCLFGGRKGNWPIKIHEARRFYLSVSLLTSVVDLCRADSLCISANVP